MGGTPQQIIRTPAPPSELERARSQQQARLETDPQIAQQEFDIQQQFLPQRAQLETALAQQFGPQLSQVFTDIQKQQMPQLQQLQAQLFPQQTQVLESAAGKVLGALNQPQDQLVAALRQQAMQQLQGPGGLTQEQSAAQEGIRGRAREQVQRQSRSRAQLGGQLFGGRPEQAETRAISELEQAFAAEDINRLSQQRSQAFQQAQQIPGLESALLSQQMQQANPFLSILFPQAAQQQPNISPFQFQSTVSSPDALLQAITANQRNFAVQPGQPSPLWDLAGTAAGGFMGGQAFGAGGGGFGSLFT